MVLNASLLRTPSSFRDALESRVASVFITFDIKNIPTPDYVLEINKSFNGYLTGWPSLSGYWLLSQ